MTQHLFNITLFCSWSDPEDIYGESLWFHKWYQLTKNVQYDAYNMCLYPCVRVLCEFCVTSPLSSHLLRFPRGFIDLNTIFVPEGSVWWSSAMSLCTWNHQKHRFFFFFSAACRTAQKWNSRCRFYFYLFFFERKLQSRKDCLFCF